MGVVHKACDTELGRTVAIKAIHDELSRKPEIRKRFIDEARIQAKLVHQNISTLFDAFDEDGKLYLVQEYVEGTTVKRMLDEAGGPLPVERAIEIARGVLSGLAHAHEEGVIHRDIKPSNIMVNKKGKIKIMDFGIAKALGGERLGKTKTGMTVGTPEYMSPEHILGKEVDARSDIYSVGMMLFEILTGNLPFEHTTSEYEIQKFHVEGTVPVLGTRNKDVPAWLNEIVQKCLAKSSDDRYNSADDGIQALTERQSSKVSLAPLPTLMPNQTIAVDLGKGVQLDMVLIPAGTFAMGSPESKQGRRDDETPRHQVVISYPFYMGKYEVTQAQWVRIMGSNPSHFKGEDLPVENVSWNDCVAFCKKLTDREQAAGRLKPGHQYRLPTEAEWEYACRAGATTRFYTGDCYSDLARAGWYAGNSSSKTHPVGQKQQNAYGLYDMHGNVWEWCGDLYGSYSSESVIDPVGQTSGSNRVVRGGCWGTNEDYCHSANRGYGHLGSAYSYYGFRLVLPAEQ